MYFNKTSPFICLIFFAVAALNRSLHGTSIVEESRSASFHGRNKALIPRSIPFIPWQNGVDSLITSLRLRETPLFVWSKSREAISRHKTTGMRRRFTTRNIAARCLMTFVASVSFTSNLLWKPSPPRSIPSRLLAHFASRKSLPAMARFNDGDGHGGDGLHFVPTENHDNTIIWLHGLGDSAHGHAPLMNQLRMTGGVFNRCKFVLPSAESKPITLNAGERMPAWADIHALDPRAEEDRTGWLVSAQRILTIVEKEAKMLKEKSPSSSSNGIVIGGFSQGGALALTSALRSSPPISGVVCLSGWLPLDGSYPKECAALESIRSTPILQCHGTDDSIVRHDYGLMSRDSMTQRLGLQVEFKSYPMEHCIWPEEIRDLSKFLENVLS